MNNKTLLVISLILAISLAGDNFNSRFLEKAAENKKQQNNQEKGRKDDKPPQKPPKEQDDSKVADLTDAQKELVQKKVDELKEQKVTKEEFKAQIDAFAVENNINIESIKKFLRPKHGDHHGKPKKDEDDSQVVDLTDAQKELVQKKIDELKEQKLSKEEFKKQLDAFIQENGISIEQLKKFFRQKHGDHHEKPKKDDAGEDAGEEDQE